MPTPRQRCERLNLKSGGEENSKEIGIMPLPVSLQAVVEEMDGQGDEVTAYLNRVTGELVSLRYEEMLMAENDESVEDLPVWQQELVQLAEKVIFSDEYMPLPTPYEIYEYDIMRRFTYALEDERLANQLDRALRGKGAFHRFKDTVHRRGVADQWYVFRQEAFERIAVAWLDEHEIPYVRA